MILILDGCIDHKGQRHRVPPRRLAAFAAVHRARPALRRECGKFADRGNEPNRAADDSRSV